MVMALASSHLIAKGATTKITIAGSGLAAPIEIFDRATLDRFKVWAGPGTRTSGNGLEVESTEGFIIDWAFGPIPVHPAGLNVYEVSFYIRERNEQMERLVYAVTYESSASSDQGYVYLPGASDDRYRPNVASIFRGREFEGRWFRASRAWQRTVAPLLASASARAGSTHQETRW
jgi:hypothetical protein